MLPQNYEPSQNFLNQIRRLPCQPSESVSSSRHSIQSMTLSEEEGQQAIQEFKRQIQVRFKISVANKIYQFPRLINELSDVISSDEEEYDKQNYENSEEMPSYLKPKLQKQQYRFTQTDRNFKKSNGSKSAHKKESLNQTKTQSRKKSKNIQKKKAQEKSEKLIPQPSKRLHTEPSSMNYISTIKLKMLKKH